MFLCANQCRKAPFSELLHVFVFALIFGIKIIIENRELLFRLRKILEKFLGIDGRIRNTTKVVLAPEK